MNPHSDLNHRPDPLLTELEAALNAMSVRGSAQGSSAPAVDQPEAPSDSQA